MRFRQGGRVPENIYDNATQPHKPIMIAANPEIAEHYVRLLNAGTCSKDIDIQERDDLIAAALEALRFIQSGETLGRQRVVAQLSNALNTVLGAV